jgi:hypothetical protein
VRVGGPAFRRIKARAKALGVTPSELVRSLIEREAGPADREPSAHAMTRRWVGSVSSKNVPKGRDARDELAGWSPDRRG